MAVPPGERSPAPVLKALLICNDVIRDRDTGQVTVVGVRDKVAARQFPHEERLSVYARMAEAGGVRMVRLDLMNLSDMSSSSIVETQSPGTQSLDPVTGLFTLVVRGERVVFPRAGDYEVLLSVEGRRLGGHRLRVEYAS